MKKALICFVCAVFAALYILSCTESTAKKETVNGNTVTVLDAVRPGLEDVQKMSLSELVDSIDIVQLETTESSLVKHIQKLSITDNYIGLQEGEGDRLYKLFDRSGRFLSIIGSRGQGPFEYLSLSDGKIDESKREVYLMKFNNANEILCYDFNGAFIKKIPLSYTVDKAKFIIRDSTIICFQMPLVNKSVFAFRQYMNGKLIDSIAAKEYMYASDFDGEIFLTDNSGEDELFYTGIDTLFHYSAQTNELIPVLHARFNEPTVHTYTEFPRFYLIWMYYDRKSNYIKIDKKSLKSSSVKLENDFMNLPISTYRCDNGYITVIYEAEDIKLFIKNKLSDVKDEKLRTKLLKLDETLSVDDNPVLFMGKFK